VRQQKTARLKIEMYSSGLIKMIACQSYKLNSGRIILPSLSLSVYSAPFYLCSSVFVYLSLFLTLSLLLYVSLCLAVYLYLFISYFLSFSISLSIFLLNPELYFHLDVSFGAILLQSSNFDVFLPNNLCARTPKVSVSSQFLFHFTIFKTKHFS